MYSILQNETSDCGLASVRTLLANAQRSPSFLYLEKKKEKGPYSYLELIEIAEDNGVTLKGFRFSNLEEFKKSKRKNQAIVTLKIKEQSHALVIDKIRKNKIFCFDPGVGEVVYTKDDFLLKWDKTALIIMNVKKNVKPLKSFSIVKKKELVLASFLEVFSSLFLVVGTFFLSEDEWYVFPIAAFALAFVFDLLFRSFAFKMLTNIDRRMNKNTEICSERFQNYMEKLENYKKSLVEMLLSSSSSFILTIFVIALFIFTDLNNIYLLFLAIGISLLNVLFFNRKEERYEKKIEKEEQAINELKIVEEKKIQYNHVHSLAYRFGYLKYSQKIFSSFVILLTVVISLLLKNSLSFPAIVFYFFFLEAFQKSLESLLSLPKSITDYRNKKGKLFDEIKIKSQNN